MGGALLEWGSLRRFLPRLRRGRARCASMTHLESARADEAAERLEVFLRIHGNATAEQCQETESVIIVSPVLCAL